MSREFSMKIVLVQAALAFGIAGSVFVFAQEEPSGIPSTSKDAPPPGSEPSENILNPSDIAKTRFEAFNGVEINIRQDGAIAITDVKEKSNAARMGLMKGDVIIRMDGHDLKSRAETELLQQSLAEQPYHAVTVERNGENIEVVLGRHLNLMGMLIVPDAGLRPLVRRVEKESPAEAAGIRAGDVITGVGGRKAETFQQFQDIVVPFVRDTPAGQEIDLRLLRETKELEVVVVRPDEVKLPLAIAPEKPPAGIPAPPKVVVMRDADEVYLNGLAALVSPYVDSPVVPFLAFQADAQGTFPVVPTPNAVAAGLYSPGGVAVKNVRVRTRVESGGAVPDLYPGGIPTPLGLLEDPTQPLQGLQGMTTTHAEFLHRQAVQQAKKQGNQTVVENVPVQVSTSRRHAFVVIDVSTGTPIIKGRMAGLSPGPYSVVVHEFGDAGDVSQHSVGSIIAVLATFTVGADGRAQIQQNLNSSVSPASLMGRVVSVVPGAYDPATNSFGAAADPNTLGPIPIASGVLGLASPARTRR